jgi:hypothetical protein
MAKNVARVPSSVYEWLDEVLPLVTRGIIRLVNQAGLEVYSVSVEVLGYILEKGYQMRNWVDIEQQHVLKMDGNTGLEGIKLQHIRH